MLSKYKVIAVGSICGMSGNMMNRYYKTIETMDKPKHSYDILLKIKPTETIGDVVELDLTTISGWDKHQLT